MVRYRAYLAISNADLAQSGRASPCQGEGRGFESRSPLHSITFIAFRSKLRFYTFFV